MNSFSDAERGKYFPQDFVGCDGAEDLAQGIKGFAQLSGQDGLVVGDGNGAAQRGGDSPQKRRRGDEEIAAQRMRE